MFLLGWVVGFVSMLVLMFWTAYKKKGVIGYAKTPKEAADMVMGMLNANQEVRNDVKNRLNASD